MQEREIVVTFDEQIVFNQLDKSKNAIWSLLLAGGYLKAEEVEYRRYAVRTVVSSSYHESGNLQYVF